jgi:hypothetical protein
MFSSTVAWRTHTFTFRYLLHSLPFQWDSTAYIENGRGGTGSNKKRISVQIKIMILFCRRKRMFEEIFIRLMGLSTQHYCIASMTLTDGFWGELESSEENERRGRVGSTLALYSRSSEFKSRSRNRLSWLRFPLAFSVPQAIRGQSEHNRLLECEATLPRKSSLTFRRKTLLPHSE